MSTLVEVVSAVIVRDGRILLTQRRSDKDFPFTWECPGGKVDGNESHHSALRRELCEELGISGADDIQIANNALWCDGFKNGVSRAERAEIFLLMYPTFVSADAKPWPREGQGIGWFDAGEMRRLPLAPGNKAALDTIVRWIARATPLHIPGDER